MQLNQAYSFVMGSLSNRFSKILFRMGICSASLVSILTGLLWYYQENLVFHPDAPKGMRNPNSNPPPYQNPGQFGMAYEDIRLKTPDGISLHAWFIKQKSSTKMSPTVLFFQGNAGNMGFRLQNFHLIYTLLKANILAVSYRGYGLSEGTPSENGLYVDAQTSLNYLKSSSEIDPQQIVIFGRSIGGAVAIDLASKNSVPAIIVENTFTTMRDMALSVFPLLRVCQFLLDFAQRLHFDSLTKIQSITSPVLFIYGEKDTLVPPNHSTILFNNANGSSLKFLYKVKNGNHNDTWQIQSESYFKYIADFLQKVQDQRKICPAIETVMG